MRIALVHDWLTGMRGGEKILEILCQKFKNAKIFTLFYIKNSVSNIIESMEIRTSFLQKFPFIRKYYRFYFPLYPIAVENFNLKGFDLIISISHCVAKGIIPPPNSLHICYCLTPIRYIWDMYHEYFDKKNFLFKIITSLIANYLRTWDISSSKRVDFFIAISKHVAKRIEKYYRRPSDIIYPPVDTSFFSLSKKSENYFLIVSALVPYKRIDFAISVFNEMKLPLLIVGKGPEEKRLKKIARKNIEFLGWVEDEELKKLYQNCKALIFPAEEDFGIAPLEAQSCGKPVIAYGRGGVTETIINGKTGIFFFEYKKEALAEAIRKFNQMEFYPEKIRENALKFDKKIFEEKFFKKIKEIINT